MKNFLRNIILLSVLWLAATGNAQTRKLPAEFAAWLGSKGMQHATVTLEVARLSSPGAEPEVIYAHDSQRAVQPASVMKLITTAATLSLLDPKQTVRTEVYFSDSCLIIRGFGNAMLSSAKSRFAADAFAASVVSALKQRGVTEVRDVVGDGSALVGNPVPADWPWEDIGNHYAPSISGLNYADNKFDIILNTSRPGRKPEVVGVVPEVEGLEIDNQLSSANYAFDSAYVYGAPMQNRMTLYGAVPHRQAQFRVKGSVPDPAQFAASSIKRALVKAGIAVKGRAVSGAMATDGQPIFVHESEPLAFVARQTNVFSVNLFAEMLIRQLGLVIEKEGSEAAGIRVLYRFLSAQGLDAGAAKIYDGCGLSPTARVTAHLMNGLLGKMQRNADFVSSLPVAGQTGTVQSLLKDTRLAGKARLKSGTTKTVIAYSGYASGSDGKTYAVTIIVNNHTCNALTVRKNIEKMLLLLIP